ncbi:putative cathepsin E [Wickerhamomyces ciferrii]|uniref:Cathepsin E n=1 Tax=Wickerhamomyces ciferrii (strain ATCC 14091 / BCRC 22168 / CBS 111 / JCM 3599 / NBRC 0793 / NRRL Y-1031 F-60-10) TaxID=1206466 RepID=K0KL17_WICCF|nr:putative cathepsin E [Wickerhamomyces ciferrii]CCH41783.1 putative cathepsin E [Wickerhamomyces ciferrii]
MKLLLKITTLILLLSEYVKGGHLELSLTKRGEKEGTIDVDLNNRESFVGIDAEIGYPPQSVELLLDTGSSTSWVMDSKNPYCVDEEVWGYLVNGSQAQLEYHFPNGLLDIKAPMGSQSKACFKHGTLDLAYSGGFEESKDPFEIKYVDNSTVKGFWTKGSFKVGDNYNLTDFDFGIGHNASSAMGILGLGIPEFEVIDGDVHYVRNNFPMKLNEDGLIGKQLFSLWLNERETKGGKILFGAIDHAKYKAPLYTMKMINTIKKGHPIQRFEILLTDLILEDEQGDKASIFGESETYKGKYTGALVDTGSTMNYLPQELFDIFISHIEHLRIKSSDQYAVKCSLQDEDDQVTFKFASKLFNIPLRNFLGPLPSSYKTLDIDEEYCLLKFMPQTSNYTVLGDSFIRSVYTVFDLDTMQISMAPAIYTDKSEIQEITYENPLISEMDGEIPKELQLHFYNPVKDFVQNTKNGYYKSLSKSSILKVNKNILFYIAVSMFFNLIFMIFL